MANIRQKQKFVVASGFLQFAMKRQFEPSAPSGERMTDLFSKNKQSYFISSLNLALAERTPALTGFLKYRYQGTGSSISNANKIAVKPPYSP
jgi:hypothetical protein